jgi:pyruvate formate lyase activating enzyme
VLVPGFTDHPREIQEVATIAAGLGNVERIDVLPFHKLGAPKYEQLGIPFPLADTPAPSPELTATVRERFAAAVRA